MKHLEKYFLSGNIIILLLLIVGCSKQNISSVQEKITVWDLNSLDSIGGNSISVWGSPQIVDAAKGNKAIAFNGKTDGILVNKNPIEGAESFTIEVVFKPSGIFPENFEQRFLHIQDPANNNRRILIELRLNAKKQWYPDLFMKTENASLTLIDSTKTHPVDEWATITLVYKDKQMKGFVNGIEELSGAIEYLPIGESGKVSLGTRMDKRSWFNGIIKTVTFRKDASASK